MLFILSLFQSVSSQHQPMNHAHARHSFAAFSNTFFCATLHVWELSINIRLQIHLLQGLRKTRQQLGW